MSSIIVQLMSGETYTLNIFDGYRIIHIKNEIASVLKVNHDLVNISSKKEGEFDILDDMDYAEDGEKYYAFVGEEEDPPEYYMKFDPSDDIDFHGIVILDENRNQVNHIKKDSTLHVQLSEDGWDFLRNVLRENRDGIIYDSEDEYDDHENDRYVRMSKQDVIRRFTNYLYTGNEYDIIIEEDDEE